MGVTTGAWAMPDPAARVRAIRAWQVLPDFASVNWHEDGAEEVAAELLDRGVAVEAGLWNLDAVQVWLVSPVRDQCFRVLLELPDGLHGADVDDTAFELLQPLTRSNSEATTILLHGEGSSAWPALRLADKIGLATRIGLEDTLLMPDGSPGLSNAGLVRAARSLMTTQ